jgi:hypothetical protein
MIKYNMRSAFVLKALMLVLPAPAPTVSTQEQ